MVIYIVSFAFAVLSFIDILFYMSWSFKNGLELLKQIFNKLFYSLYAN